MPSRIPQLPGGPLLKLLPADTALAIRECPAPAHERSRIGAAINSARERGWVNLYAADLVCLRLLRLHPAEVWGEDYWLCDGPLPELTQDDLWDLEPPPPVVPEPAAAFGAALERAFA